MFLMSLFPVIWDELDKSRGQRLSQALSGPGTTLLEMGKWVSCLSQIQ